MYSCYVDTLDESNISYVEVEVLEISEYEASKYNNSFKQNLKYVTGENKERYFKANMLLIYIDGCWNKESEEDYLTEIQFPISKR